MFNSLAALIGNGLVTQKNFADGGGHFASGVKCIVGYTQEDYRIDIVKKKITAFFLQ